jgi:hypothetical protein
MQATAQRKKARVAGGMASATPRAMTKFPDQITVAASAASAPRTGVESMAAYRFRLLLLTKRFTSMPYFFTL